MGMAVANGPSYYTTDNIHVPSHPQTMWDERFPRDDRDVADAWRQATPVDSDRAPVHSAIYARVCPDAAALLLAQGRALVTVLYVALEPIDEQHRWVGCVSGLTWPTIQNQSERVARGDLPSPEDHHGEGLEDYQPTLSTLPESGESGT